MVYWFIGIYLRMFTRENVRTRISIFFVFFIFYSKRPSASLEPVMSLIFVPNRSASVRGVHRHQAIVILACHVSSENRCHLHGTTTHRVPRLLCPHSNRACRLLHVFPTYIYHCLGGGGGGGFPPVIIQPKIGETSVKNHLF